MTDEMEGQVSIFDQDIWCGKMFQELSAPTTEKTSELSWKRPPKSQKNQYLFLDLRKASGQTQDVSSQTDGALLGEYSMLSFGESPREDEGSHLSQILEGNPHPKYYLSARAAMGIKSRAERRGKKLPQMLQEALDQVIALDAIGMGGE